MAGSLDSKLEAKLEALAQRVEGLADSLADPQVTGDMERYRSLARSYAELQPVVVQFRDHRKIDDDLESARELASSSDDPELRLMAVEEVKQLEEQLAQSEQALKVMLLADDPNDAKNVVLEIRAGTGGNEATLFAAELFRMYCRFAESEGWKVKTTTLSDSPVGGLKPLLWVLPTPGSHSLLVVESGLQGRSHHLFPRNPQIR